MSFENLTGAYSTPDSVHRTAIVLCLIGGLTIAIRVSQAQDFAQRGPRDSQGRSLRDSDLQQRIFKYPCSYLVYSEAFDSLPTESRDLGLKRLFDVLSGADQSKPFAHLTDADRVAILQILRETKSNLPDYWKLHRATAQAKISVPSGRFGSGCAVSH